MAFWENISQKVNETTNKTVSKAKELSDVVKLNSMISEEERKVKEVYLQIGKLYVKEHEEDFEEAFADLIAMAKASDEKITDYRQQIRELKGIATCPTCGAEVPSGAAFCNACGTKLPEIQVEEKKEGIRCAGCGAILSEDSRFCTECGRPVVVEQKEEVFVEAEEVIAAPSVEEPVMEDVTVEEPSEEAVAEEAPVVEVQGNVCPNCGSHMADDAMFCTECGTKL